MRVCVSTHTIVGEGATRAPSKHDATYLLNDALFVALLLVVKEPLVVYDVCHCRGHVHRLYVRVVRRGDGGADDVPVVHLAPLHGKDGLSHGMKDGHAALAVRHAATVQTAVPEAHSRERHSTARAP